MSKCSSCPLASDDQVECYAITSGHRRFCELIASGRDDYRDLVIRLTHGDPPPQPTPPGLAAMAGNLARAVVAHVADGGRKASPEVQAERERICRACPNFDPTNQRCVICGCTNMPLKWSWASSACPDVPERWKAVP